MDTIVEDLIIPESVRKLYGFISDKRLKFIGPLIRLLLELNLLTVPEVQTFLINSRTLFYIRKAEFVQVGGPFCYTFLVSCLSVFKKISYIGALSESDQATFAEVNDLSRRNNLCEVSSIEQLTDSTRIKIVCFIDPSEELYEICKSQESVIFMNKISAKRLNCKSLMTGIRFNLGELIFFTFSPRLNQYSPYFTMFLQLENEKIWLSDIADTLLSDNYTFTQQNVDSIKNELHRQYISYNVDDILRNLCLLMIQYILKITRLPIRYDLVRDCFFFLLIQMYHGFSLCVFSILYKVKVSAFLLTLFIEGIDTPSLGHEIFSSFTHFESFKIKRIPNKIKDLMLETYKTIIKNNLDAKFGLSTLDQRNNQYEEELNKLNKLLPEEIMLHHRTFNFLGKTLLGGTISVSAEIYPNNDNDLEETRFLLILRNELSHKKRLVLGSRNYLSDSYLQLSTPEEIECENLLDMETELSFNPSFVLSLKEMTEEIEAKIKHAEKLSNEEIKKLYIPVKNTVEVPSNMMILEPGQRVLCTGRYYAFSIRKEKM